MDERQRLRGRISELEARIRAAESGSDGLGGMLDALREGLQVISADWRYLYVNRAAAAHGRRDRRQLLGRTMMECYPGIEKTEMFAALRRCMERREPASLENEFTFPDGSTGWFELRVQPAPEGLIVLSLDITERKQLEQRALHSQKMEAVGRLAGSIAHDFNNLLTGIISFGHLAAMQVEAASPARADLREVVRAAERAGDLTKRLLSFFRTQVPRPRPTSANALVTELAPMLERVLPENIELVVRSAEDEPVVLVDPSRIEQVLLNLAINARDEMPAGGRIEIEVQSVTVKQTQGVLTCGAYARIAVADTGPGVPEDIAEKVFDHFFTTKSQGRGTGLGLGTSRESAREAGGDLILRREHGAGAIFDLYLPRRSDIVTSGDRAGPEPEPVAVAAPAAILVVEDERAVRCAIVRTLSRAGYEVLAAPDAASARALVADREGPLDLVLTDVMLPDGTGPALVEELQGMLPLRVLFMSGYGTVSLAQDAVVVPKPFGPKVLTDAVRSALTPRR